ncbi:MAG TPA: S53 family peptidase [Steroidobacteraceae bacterium]|jgi:kumamolisin|nr:S53 family peptidase [Steroidobacteraceae bacterium]
MAKILLKGSERLALPGARVIGPADPSERLEVTVLVRRRGRPAMQARVADLAAGKKVGHLSRDEFARDHGADAADLARVHAFAQSQGLAVVQEHAARRTVVLAGTVAQFAAAFGIRLYHMSHAGGTYRGRTGGIYLPAEWDGVVEAILGLDNRPQARPHFRVRRAPGNIFRHAASPLSYTPPEVAAFYGYPASTGAGQCVALIELGGGYRPADLNAYFSGLSVQSPSVTAVSVDQVGNSPTGDAEGPDGEVMLDIEVVGSIAPGARIAVYFAPNTDAGFLDAITTAIHDTANNPSVLSISWGSAESTWTPQAMSAMDEAFQAATALGLTVCVAAGDNGSSDGVSSGGDHVDFPASSPHVLACGGTRLQATQTAISSETVWNDGANGGATGGGISSFFAVPAWQSGLSASTTKGRTVPLSMRGVPDVAGDADPGTGYDVRVDGTDSVIGGTSAVAPLWAALIARINASTGKNAGLINPQLYQNPRGCRDITQGNNGDYAATAGWDACTGLGSPNGDTLAGLL